MSKPSLPTLGIFWQAIRLVGRCWRPLLIYGAIVYVVVGLVLAPLSLWVLAEVLSLARSDVVLNYDLASLALSPAGVILGLLWGILICALGVIAYGGGALITAAGHTGTEITMRGVGRRVLGTVHRIAGWGIVRLTAWFLLLGPAIIAVATALTAAILAPFGAAPVEHWIPDEVAELAWVVPAALGFLVLGFVLYVRWVLSIHCLVLEGLPLSKALRRSAQLVSGHFWPMARAIGVHHVAAGLFIGVVTLLLGLLDVFVLERLPDQTGPLFRGTVAFLMVTNTLVFGAATALAMAHGLGLATILYERLAGGLTLDAAEPARRPGARRRRKLVFGLFVIALAGATALTVPEVAGELKELDRAVVVVAHRGSSKKAPENTLAAIRLSIEEGAHFVEFDVQETKDGAIVATHDASMQRTTGVDLEVHAATLAEIRALDAGSWFGEEFSGEKVPTLDEVLELAKGRIRLNIELKVHGREKNFAPSVIDAIRRFDMEEECVIQSLDYPVLQEIRKLAPALPVGIIVSASVGRLDRLDVDFYSVQPEYATVSFVRRAHADERYVLVWTINTRTLMTRFFDRGVDGIITDYPEVALAVLDERSEADELYAALLRLFRR